MCSGPKTLHYAKFWAQNATKTSARNIPESLSNLFLRDNCRLSQRLLNNAKFFLLGKGEGGARGAKKEGGTIVIENPRRGLGHGRGGARPEGPGGCLQGIRGEGG